MTDKSKTISVPWGKSELSFELPQGWKLKAELNPVHPETLPPLEAELDRALQNPVNMPPLREFAKGKKTACIIVDDRTRPTPASRVVPGVLSELHAAGIKDEDIVFIMALGTHRDMTDQELAERLGQEAAGKYRVVNHRYDDKQQNVFVGKTPTHKIPVSFDRVLVESDLIVAIGCIVAHEQAGFGGGFKSFMPGCSGPEAISATHTAKFQKPVRISSSGMPKQKCRFRQAVDECGLLLGPKVFLVNTVLDPINTVAVVAGDPVEAHQQGCKIYAEMAAVKVDGPADAVIVNAHPLDLDLRLAMKACFNASDALKPGGLFISMALAPEALGDLRLPQKLPPGVKGVIKKAPISLIEPIALRVNTSPDQAAGTVSLMKILKTASNWLYYTPVTEGIGPLRKMGIEFFDDMDALMQRAAKINPKAEALVFPRGGASYLAWD